MKKPTSNSVKKNNNTSAKKQDATGCKEQLTLETVEIYIKYKAFDVIGNGNYRRYVNSCREKNEPWAVEITQAVSQITAATKTIQSLVNDLQNNNKTGKPQCTRFENTAILFDPFPPLQVSTRYARQ